MRPRERRETGQRDLFRARLDQIVALDHPLVKLARAIDWSFLEERCGAVYTDEPGRPPLPTRLMAGLAILKHMRALSDEVLCERWVENPYDQLFCGEEFFRHTLPFDRSSLTRWRQRMGEDKLIALIQESLAVATRVGAAKPADFRQVILDTTVQEKAITFPTDAKLVDSSGRRNTLTEGVAMRAGRRRSDRALRAVLPGSPGRPGVAQRENRRRFWAAIAAGRSSEAAAIEAGVSPTVGARWFREAGGMSPKSLAPSAKPPSGRYLVFAEREEIALCRAQGQGIREIARRLGRAASTISRGSRASCAATPPRAAAGWRIGPAPRSGMPSGRPDARRGPSLRPPRRCGRVWRSACLAQSPPRAGPLWLGRPWPGRAAGTGVGSTAGGPRRGARGKSPGACGSTSLGTRPCASATRRSIGRFTCRGAGRCGAS